MPTIPYIPNVPSVAEEAKKKANEPKSKFEIISGVLPVRTQRDIIRTAGQKADAPAAPTPSAADDYRAAIEKRDQSLQSYFDQRKAALEKDAATNTRLARYNALGRALKALATPIGWVAGGKGTGATVQNPKYDDRQYIEAFNRAVKAGQDISNLASEKAAYDIKLASTDASTAATLYGKELDRQNKMVQKAVDFEYDKALNDHNTENELKKIGARSQYRQTENEAKIAAQESMERLKAGLRLHVANNKKPISADQQDSFMKRIESEYTYMLRRYYDGLSRGEDPEPIPSAEEFFNKAIEMAGYTRGKKEEKPILDL